MCWVVGSNLIRVAHIPKWNLFSRLLTLESTGIQCVSNIGECRGGGIRVSVKRKPISVCLCAYPVIRQLILPKPYLELIFFLTPSKRVISIRKANFHIYFLHCGKGNYLGRILYCNTASTRTLPQSHTYGIYFISH